MTRIFVYGTLKRGCCRSHVLRNQQFLAEATTAARYRMYDVGTYPALVEDEAGIEIQGEIWEVDDMCLKMLDAIEGVPTLYERRPVAVQQADVDGVQTYIYQQSVAGLPECGGRWVDCRKEPPELISRKDDP